MDPARWRRVSAVLQDAIALPPTERTAFLERACADRDDRREVESLLRHHEAGERLPGAGRRAGRGRPAARRRIWRLVRRWAPTSSCARSAGAGWAWSIWRATPGWTVTSRSRCCRRPAPRRPAARTAEAGGARRGRGAARRHRSRLRAGGRRARRGLCRVRIRGGPHPARGATGRAAAAGPRHRHRHADCQRRRGRARARRDPSRSRSPRTWSARATAA